MNVDIKYDYKCVNLLTIGYKDINNSNVNPKLMLFFKLVSDSIPTLFKYTLV